MSKGRRAANPPVNCTRQTVPRDGAHVRELAYFRKIAGLRLLGHLTVRADGARPYGLTGGGRRAMRTSARRTAHPRPPYGVSVGQAGRIGACRSSSGTGLIRTGITASACRCGGAA
jgi:hypothetical protein